MSDDKLFRQFQPAISALEAARAAEAPTYAPQRFAQAVAHYERARSLSRECAPTDQVEQALQATQAALEAAMQIAARVSEQLADVVAQRTHMMQDEWSRYFAPQALNDAEEVYREMILAAEEGASGAAEERADKVLALYREATLLGMQQGPLRQLKDDLSSAAELAPEENLRSGEAVVARLDEAFELARAGELGVGALQRRLAAGGDQLSRLRLRDDVLGPGFDYTDPGIRDWAPGTFEPPPAPITMRIMARTSNAITVRWRNRAGIASAHTLEQKRGDGPWQAIAGWSSLSGWTTFMDTGLTPDTLYCYRVRVGNGYGSNVTPNSKIACAYTRDGNDLSIWRLQLRLRVANVSDADSNDSVQVRLNSPLMTKYTPSGNGTWLDYGPDYSVIGGTVYVEDDFDRGREFTYDLNLSHASELGDITMISFKKEGTDALGIAEFALLVNGVPVFERFFGETKGTCLWIDDGDGYQPTYTVNHAELRAHANWQAYIASPPFPSLTIPNAEIVSRIEGMIGDRIHGTKLKWGKLQGSEWISATRAGATRLHIDVDLEAMVFGPNAEVDIDFDLEFTLTCEDDAAQLSITTANVDVDAIYSLFDDIITLGIVEFFDDNIEKEVKKAFDPITESFEIPAGGLCPEIRVDPNGDVRFVL